MSDRTVPQYITEAHSHQTEYNKNIPKHTHCTRETYVQVLRDHHHALHMHSRRHLAACVTSQLRELPSVFNQYRDRGRASERASKEPPHRRLCHSRPPLGRWKLETGLLLRQPAHRGRTRRQRNSTKTKGQRKRIALTRSSNLDETRRTPKFSLAQVTVSLVCQRSSAFDTDFVEVFLMF